MKLIELLKNIKVLDSWHIDELEIKKIKYDSRQIEKGDLFVAVKGFATDGHKYIKNALRKGARAVVIEDVNYCSKEYPWVLVNNSRETLADLANNYFDHPSQKFTLIGVTGTNGKTTTTNLIAKILEQQGEKVGLIGTIHNRIGEEILFVERTTPESLDLQCLFAKMVEAQVTHVIMEVSSHALDLDRVRGCVFDIVVFTNLTQDHLDYHKNMENYFQAKAKLFSKADNQEKIAIINSDDSWGKKLLNICDCKKISYGLEEPCDLQGKDLHITPRGVSYLLDSNLVQLNLTGKFNAYNSLATLAVAKAIGIPIQQAVKSLSSVEGIAGRFQVVNPSDEFTVIVDYAHTPDSLVNILITAREITQGKIITVFGCGGDRDRTKRPLMGKVAAQYSDFCFITSDNPRTEDPLKIIEDILPGVKEVTGEEKFIVEVKRKDAIKKALTIAEKGDMVIIAGKGHENYQEINGKKYPFDDKLIVQDFLTKNQKGCD